MDTKAKIITISSGKGGVGKTCSSVNLSILLAQQGYKVCLFDADANLANVNIMLKLAPEYTLEHVLSAQKSLRDITLHKAGIDIIPGASGITNFVTLSPVQQKRLLATMKSLKSQYDYLVIDNPAGISENVLSFIKFSDHAVIIITPEPTSLTDAFALIRVMQRRGNVKPVQVIVNNASNKEHAGRIYRRFQAAVSKHIGSELNYLGCVLTDEKMSASVILQNPVVQQYPASVSARNYTDLSIKLASLSNVASPKPIQQSLAKPAKREASTLSTKSPDFSTQAELHTIKPVTANGLSLEVLASELINAIDNKNQSEQSLRARIKEINRAYLQRFGEYAFDLQDLLHDAMKPAEMSEMTLRNVLMTLKSYYQDQYGVTSSTSEALEPANVVNTRLTQESIDHLIMLLQQESIQNMQQQLDDKPPVSNPRSPQLVPPIEKASLVQHELLDSIRYAALVDK